MRIILRKRQKRKAEDKESTFYVRGREVKDEKINRFAQRKKISKDMHAYPSPAPGICELIFLGWSPC